jgi:hypothetical protein
MKREKYVYNPNSLQFEKHRVTARDIFLRIFGYLSVVLISAFALMMLTYHYFPSPKEKALGREIMQMDHQFDLMNQELDKMSNMLGSIQDRDANIHRMMFGMEPIDDDVWNGGIGGHDRYAMFKNFQESGEIMRATRQKLDKLGRQMSIQTKSLDSLHVLALEKENKIASIPSIKPIREDKLKRRIKLLSGYGMRIHPIHKLPKMHYGLDFTCERGTEIQSTGKGKVIRIRRSRSGYGNSILIDHGYGYQTLYAHMKEMIVKEGEMVVKGQKIGTVGNTGTSTAPHLHYEVRKNGQPVNPIDYCLDGLTPEEYQLLVKLASETNQSFDY